MKPHINVLWVLIALSFAASGPAQTTSTWSLVGDGDWKNAANWDTIAYPDNGQPAPGDTYSAVLNTNRTLTLDGSVSIQGLTQSTGTITGTADKELTLAGLFGWTGGALTGGMTVHANGGVTISNSVNHELSGGTIFNNDGTMNWSQGNIGNNVGTWTFNNTASGVINVNLISASQIFGSFSPETAIHNAGTLNIATANSAYNLNVYSPLHNSGLVDITSNYTILHGGTNTGQIQVAAGKTLQFSTNNFTQSGSGSITGAGLVQAVSSGAAPIRFNAGTTYDVGSTLVQSGDMYFDNAATTGTLTLMNTGRLFGNGSITVSGLFTWTGSGGFPYYSTAIFDSLKIFAEGGLLMNGEAKVILGGGRVENSGAAIWSSGNLVLKPTGGSAGTSFVNAADGTLDLQFDGQIQAGGTASTNFFTNAGTFTKSAGTGTSLFNTVSTNTASGAIHVNSGTLSIWQLNNAGSIQVASGATLTFHDQYTSTGGAYTQTAGSLTLDGGTVTKSGTNLAINGGSVLGHGTINGRISNSALVRAQGGTLTISNGVDGTTGNVEVAAAATLQLNGTASSASTLSHSGSGLALASNFTIHDDYQNTSFGTGNTFAPRANVTGVGNILAAGTTAQSITGSAISNGTTATPTLQLPTIRQGQSITASFQIHNPGTTGPLLRGALQTNVNGANITDSRLSGSGVTPGAFSLSSNSSTSDYLVELTGTSGGPLTGQTLTLLNNFSNVPDQTVTINGAVWGHAQPQITSTTPIAFGNVRIGKVLPYVPVAIKNNAPADGWHEGLTVTPQFTNVQHQGAGTITAMLPQDTDDDAIAVRIATDTFGPVAGQVLLEFESDGTGTSSLNPNVPLPSQSIAVTGTVFRLASPKLVEDTHKFGPARVGESVAPFVLEIGNSSGLHREGLNAEFDTLTIPNGFLASGSITGLAPGSSSTAMEIHLDTSTTGDFNSDELCVDVASDGVATDEAPLDLDPLKVSLSGSVWQPAIAVIPGAPNLHLGNVRLDTPGLLFIPVLNDAPNNGLSEELMANFLTAADGDFTFDEIIKYLPPQVLNTSSMKVLFETTTPGPRTGQATLAFASNGDNTSGIPDELPLANQTVNLSAGVFRPAVGNAEDSQIIAYVRKQETDTVTGKLRIRNLAEDDSYSERLIARIDSFSSNLLVDNGESSLVDPDGEDDSLSVTATNLLTFGNGILNETVTLSYGTTGGGVPATSGLPEAPAGGKTINVLIHINVSAEAILTKVSGPSSFNYNDITYTGGGDFATVNSTQGPKSLTVQIKNSLPDQIMDNLKATFDTSALGPFTLVSPVAYPSNGLAPGASRNFSVTLDPAALPAGPVSGTLVIHQTSSNPTSDLELPPITLTFTADIYVPSPYEIWATGYDLTGPYALPEADPDQDGHTNSAEFAFDGNPNDPKSGPMVIPRVFEDGDSKFLAVLVRVRKGDESAFIAADDIPPYDRPSRATRDRVNYVALAATTPGAAIDAINNLIPGELLKVIPFIIPLDWSAPSPPSSPDYEDVAFRITATTEDQPKAFFRMSAQPTPAPEE